MIRAFVVGGVLMMVPVLHAGPGIRWTLNVQQAVAQARKTNTPLMFYIKGSSGGDDDIEDFERDHKRAFADPRVYALSKKFVCVQLSRSRYRQQLEQWQISPRTNLNIVFAAPSGERIGFPLAASAIAVPATLAAKMQEVYERWGRHLFKSEVHPTLSNAESKPADLQKALDLAKRYEMRDADRDVLALLDRKLDKRTQSKCLDALAAIASKLAVDALVDRAAGGDRLAAKALQELRPAGVPTLLTYLGGEDMARHIVAYHAVVKVCRIRGAKPDAFWKGLNAASKQREIDRVRHEAEEYMQRKGVQP